jgi:hypothetical protein
VAVAVIVLVTGAPGSGKSYYAVRKIAESLIAGKVVATNIQLSDGWERKLARSSPITRLIPGRVAKREADLRSRLLVSSDLDELFRVRVEGTREGRADMVLDEAHHWLNARTWDGHGGDRKSGVTERLKVVRFFSAHRHLGWNIYCITQDAANIDRQVRSLFEYHVRLKNLRNFKIAGIPILPVKLFLAIWFWNDGAKTIVKREAYRLTRRARLYNTHALATAGDLAVDDPIVLPRRAPVDLPPLPADWTASDPPAEFEDDPGAVLSAVGATMGAPKTREATAPTVASLPTEPVPGSRGERPPS